MRKQAQLTTLFEGRHLHMMARGHWEYATRVGTRPAVGIVALTDDQRVLLVEQFRPPIQANSIEIPAGLVGDIAGNEDEQLLEAARRELQEETGYHAEQWTEIAAGYSSPGLTDESIHLFLAEGLKRVSAGGGDASESIRVHEVPLDNVDSWLQQQCQRGAGMDLKLLAGLRAAEHHLRQRRH